MIPVHEEHEGTETWCPSRRKNLSDLLGLKPTGLFLSH